MQAHACMCQTLHAQPMYVCTLCWFSFSCCSRVRAVVSLGSRAGLLLNSFSSCSIATAKRIPYNVVSLSSGWFRSEIELIRTRRTSQFVNYAPPFAWECQNIESAMLCCMQASDLTVYNYVMQFEFGLLWSHALLL